MNEIMSEQCDVPTCPCAAEVTKVSQADEEIRLCLLHQDLVPEEVVRLTQIWIESL